MRGNSPRPKLAKQVAKTDTPPIGAFLDVASLTTHIEVNKLLKWAFFHAVNGEGYGYGDGDSEADDDSE